MPFGPHPHKGIETVTLILKGDILHKDSEGYESIIKAGGVQWMTAGSGLIHSETSSAEFKENGGDLEILQLWINLPSRLKMTPPHYTGIQKDKIPKFDIDEGKIEVSLISGCWGNHTGALESITGVLLSTISIKADSVLDLRIPVSHNIFFYVMQGILEVNGMTVKERQLVDFGNNDEKIEVKSQKKSNLLFAHAQPVNEPVVARGPFVMNTEQEIIEAYHDYETGKFGQWRE